jgi:riboflavin kinase/FMN adenylyltransferase
MSRADEASVGALQEHAIDPALEAPLPHDARGAVVTVGTFDGVHRGHQQVLAALAAHAAEHGRRAVLATFDPHPLRVVRPEAAPPLLTTVEEKKEILAATGLEYAVFIPFTRTLQQYPARRFVEEILVGRLAMRELVIGYDHGFGRGREAGTDAMRELGRELGFAVHVVEAVRAGADAEAPISSSAIRRALLAGDVEAAAHGLGRPYSLQGRVVPGAQRGRALGFPTANLEVGSSEKLIPLDGIYAVHGIFGGERVPGLLHLGPVPTFSGQARTVELYLFDWSGDLYGRTVRVDFRARLRGIEAFDSVGALVEQMQRDEQLGRALLAAPSACAERMDPLS